jgi:tetratricopeptide (TPR) repeat protein
VDFIQTLLDPGSTPFLIGVGGIVAAGLLVLLVYLSIRKRYHPYLRAVKHRERGDLAGARGFLALAMEDSEYRNRALLLRADIATETGAYGEAIKDYSMVLQLKKPGDGIDPEEARTRLLYPLYREGRIMELNNLCREMLQARPGSPDARYYLGLIYLSMLYAGEAVRLLAEAVRVRPGMHQALFALAVALALQRRYPDALRRMAQARAADDQTAYKLAHAVILHLAGKYQESVNLCGSLPKTGSGYRVRRLHHLYLRLRGMNSFRLGDYAEARRQLQLLYRELQEYYVAPETGAPVAPGAEGSVPSGRSTAGRSNSGGETPTGVYDQFGKARTAAQSPQQGSHQGKPESSLQEYYRLKEVALEEGRVNLVKTMPSPNRILDIEGLSEVSRAALGAVFTLARREQWDDTLQALDRAAAAHPEVLGLRRLRAVLLEAKPGAEEERGRQTSDEKGGAGRERAISEASKERTRPGPSGREKLPRFTLEDYLSRWENEMLKAHHLADAAGFISRKRLNPVILFRKEGRFGLDT